MLSLGKFSFDEDGLYAVLQSPRGPVARYLRFVGEQTTVISKTLAGVRTGRLKRSISMSTTRTLGKYTVVVGSDVRHALVHHQGAAPHVIRARRPGGLLVFRGRTGLVRTPSVDHPGHAANPYLVKAVTAALKKSYRMR
jgi:hypothetical protein